MNKILFPICMLFILAGCESESLLSSNDTQSKNECKQLIEFLGIIGAYDTCIQEAKAGNPISQLALADEFKKGNLGQENVHLAKYWYKQAANNNNPNALFYVAKYHIRQNEIDEGIKYLKKAAENNLTEAQVILAKLYYTGEYFKQDVEQAKYWFQRGVVKNDAESQFYLSEIYRKHQVSDENSKLANYWLRKSAEQEYVPAIEAISEILIENKNYPLAAKWLEKSNELGSAKGQFLLAKLIQEKKIAQSHDPIELLRTSSQHYIPAQVRLALVYKSGFGTAKNIKLARRMLENAAELGHEEAFYVLGLAYIRGEFGIEQNVAQGIDYLKVSAKKGYQPAKFTLSTLFIDGQPILKDKTEVIKNLALQAIQDQPEAQFKLAKVLAEFNIPVYDRVSFYWLKKAARTNDDHIHYALADYYAKGIGTEADYKKAHGLYQYLANKGYAPAYMSLAKMYHIGQGVQPSSFMAKNWVVKAIAADIQGARDFAKELFKDGEDLNITMQDSNALMEFAAESNFPTALYTQGKCYLEGKKGYMRSIPKGIDLLHKAASQEYILAQRELGMIYENNLYDTNNRQVAYDWYTKAALKGDNFSQYRLAYMYFHQPVAGQDKIKAYAWANLAASTGLLPAEDLRELIFTELDPDELEDAQALSLKYYKNYQNDEELVFLLDDLQW